MATLNMIISGRTQKEYREDHKDKIKEYREDHKDKISKQNKEFRETNKEKIQQRVSEHVFCICGCSVRKDNMTKHKKSPKHERIMKEITEVHS